MVFSSLIFLYQFLPLVLLLYFVIPRRFLAARNLVLLVFSLLFYSWGETVAIWLMVGSILLNYLHGWLVERFCGRGERKKARAVVASAVVLNLLLLGIFKYADFFLQSAAAVLGRDLPLLHIALPIGISFYTFQSLSYPIDIYRGEARAQKSLIAFGMYVSFFPQLIAGPIVTFHSIADQLTNRRESADSFSRGISRFMQGLGKKVLFANNIGLLWEQISAMPTETMPVLTAWLGIIAFAFQIYFDFSGYSDMAVGLGLLFGFHFPENFNHPYLSTDHHANSGGAGTSRSAAGSATVCLYPAGRKPERAWTLQLRNIADCMGTDGNLARGKLELPFVGSLFRRAADSGKAVSASSAGKSTLVCASPVCPVSHSDRLGALCL